VAPADAGAGAPFEHETASTRRSASGPGGLARPLTWLDQHPSDLTGLLPRARIAVRPADVMCIERHLVAGPSGSSPVQASTTTTVAPTASVPVELQRAPAHPCTAWTQSPRRGEVDCGRAWPIPGKRASSSRLHHMCTDRGDPLKDLSSLIGTTLLERLQGDGDEDVSLLDAVLRALVEDPFCPGNQPPAWDSSPRGPRPNPSQTTFRAALGGPLAQRRHAERACERGRCPRPPPAK
jgi:hypothetical protein